jgi:uncharacterized membrane protein
MEILMVGVVLLLVVGTYLVYRVAATLQVSK